jgi:hypothetical protein
VSARGLFLCFMLGLLGCFLPLFLALLTVRDGDSCFVGYREVGFIPEELLQGQGWISSLLLLLLVFWLHNLVFHKPFCS